MLTFFEILIGICKVCGLLLVLCAFFSGTRFVEKVQAWMKRHQKITAVFAVMAMIGLLATLVSAIIN